MSSIATLNGVQYIIPAYNDTGWAQGAGNLSLYLAAIAANTLQPTGGSFTLTADVDFGANFGVKTLFLKTETANPASAGVIRLASADTIKWRNNANSADIALSKTTGDLLQFNGTNVITGGTGLIVNADINASAAIALSKLAALTISKAAVTDASGVLTTSTTSAAELAFVAGVTSAIQTQINTKATDTAVVHNTGAETVAGVKSFSSAIKNTTGSNAIQMGAVSTTGQVGNNYDLGSIPNTANSSAAISLLCPAGAASVLIATSATVNTAVSTVATFANAGVSIKGSNTNDNAAAGDVGEVARSYQSTATNYPATGTYGDLTSISLTAGDWDVTGVVSGFANGTTTLPQLRMGIGTVSGNNVPGQEGDSLMINPGSTTSDVTQLCPGYRVSLSSTTTIYLKYYAQFTGTAPQAIGRINARRAR